jgi:hypothetical protein
MRAQKSEQISIFEIDKDYIYIIIIKLNIFLNFYNANNYEFNQSTKHNTKNTNYLSNY